MYIGKGSVDYNKSVYKGGYDDRAFDFSHRNKDYKEFIKNIGKENVEVRIVARFNEEKDALWLEKQLHLVHNGLYSLAGESLSKRISESTRGKNSPHCKKVICITTGETFDYIKKGANKYNVDYSNISNCCRGKLKSAGKINGKKLVWKYLDDVA